MRIKNKKIYQSAYLLIVGLLAVSRPIKAMDVRALSDLTPDTAGIETPFSAGVWGNETLVSTIMQEIKKVAALPLSPAERQVFAALVTTDVGGSMLAEQIDAEIAGGQLKAGDFLQVRTEALLQQGLFEEVLAVLNQIPEPQETNEMRQTKATALWGLGRTDEACAERLIASFSKEDGALRRFLCSVANGSADEATLAYDVYRENVKGGTFATAAGDNLYHYLKSDLPSGEPTVWEAPLSARAFGRTLFAKPLARGVLRAIALNPGVPADIRLTVAEKAVLTAADWDKLLMEPMTDKAVTAAEKRVNDYRRGALREYLTSMVQDGVTASLASVAIKLIQSVTPDETHRDIAPVAVRIAALSDERATVETWYEFLKTANENEALKLAALYNAVGGGVPASLDPLIDACTVAGTCEKDLRGVPFYFPISLEKALVVAASESPAAGYAGFVTAAVQHVVESEATGLGLLYGVSLLNQSKAPERPLVQALGRRLPVGMTEALLVERLIGEN